MKKIIKTTCLVLSLLLICLTFCSCNALDEMKEAQAYYVGDDIVFRGETYKKLMTSTDADTISMVNFDVGNVTERDVPVLLSNIVGNDFFYSSNGLIEAGELDADFSYSYYYYCREDLYDYLSNVIDNNEFDHFCISYYDFEAEEYKNQLLDEDLTSVFKMALETYYVGGYDDYFNDYSETSHSDASVYLCDSKMLLRSEWFDLVYDKTLGSYLLTNDNVYVIPAEHTEMVSTVIEKVTNESAPATVAN